MAEEEPPKPYWFNVRYGEGETALFNADCWAIVLLDYIKERCGYAHLDEPIDLMNEGGTCINLRDVGKEDASSLIESKGTYILCKVVAPEEGSGGAVTFEQLWEAPEGFEAPAAPAAGKKK